MRFLQSAPLASSCFGVLVLSLLVGCGGDGPSVASPSGPAGTDPASTNTSSIGGGVSSAGQSSIGPSAGSSFGGSGNGSGGSVSSAGGSNIGVAPGGMPLFPASAPFYQDISQAKVDPQSAAIMKALDAIGWGDSDKRTKLGIDFSFNINLADASVALRPFTKSRTFYSPDCDTAPVPLPVGGKGEGVSNYACSGGDDCHLFVFQGARLYELYQSNISGGLAVGGTFTATCLALWDLNKDYWASPASGTYSRGDGCTGADAAGLPMAPLVLTKAELAAGAIKHALRFTIDNNRIAAGSYVHPATHLGGPTGGADMLPYGARIRLRADYDLASLPNAHARTVARALQTYGMYLADGGNIYVSATADAVDLIDNSILSGLAPRDFEMVDGGPRIDAANQDCKHVPITQ